MGSNSLKNYTKYNEIQILKSIQYLPYLIMMGFMPPPVSMHPIIHSLWSRMKVERSLQPYSTLRLVLKFFFIMHHDHNDFMTHPSLFFHGLPPPKNSTSCTMPSSSNSTTSSCSSSSLQIKFALSLGVCIHNGADYISECSRMLWNTYLSLQNNIHLISSSTLPPPPLPSCLLIPNTSLTCNPILAAFNI